MGTEYNPDFLRDFNAKVGPYRDNLLVFVDDNAVGTLTPSQFFPNGKCCHSLMACYLTGIKGFADCKMNHIDGGLQGWVQAGGGLVPPEDF